jgi:hypothetical protein
MMSYRQSGSSTSKGMSIFVFIIVMIALAYGVVVFASHPL